MKFSHLRKSDTGTIKYTVFILQSELFIINLQINYIAWHKNEPVIPERNCKSCSNSSSGFMFHVINAGRE